MVEKRLKLSGLSETNQILVVRWSGGVLGHFIDVEILSKAASLKGRGCQEIDQTTTAHLTPTFTQRSYGPRSLKSHYYIYQSCICMKDVVNDSCTDGAL